MSESLPESGPTDPPDDDADQVEADLAAGVDTTDVDYRPGPQVVD